MDDGMDTPCYPASVRAKLKVQTINYKQEVSEMKVTLIGIDLAKNIFQVCGVNQAGRQVFNKAIKRARLSEFLIQYAGIPIAMEACSGSNHWGRTFAAAGHEVKLIPPQHVKPFVKGNKNDRNDAFAICEAAGRPQLKTVQPRTLEQTDLMVVHRIRERRVVARTALINQMRGLLAEYGIVLAQGKSILREALPALLEVADNGLTGVAREQFQYLLAEWQAHDAGIAQQEKTIKERSRACAGSMRLLGIKGVGEITATALVAYAGNGTGYQNGRHFSASLGLVPSEHSSGGKQRLGGITKRGNGYLRHCLIQGAWSVLRYADTSQDRLSVWARKVVARRGKHKAAIAVANKLARIAWTLLYYQRDYNPHTVV
jgi:transposase